MDRHLDRYMHRIVHRSVLFKQSTLVQDFNHRFLGPLSARGTSVGLEIHRDPNLPFFLARTRSTCAAPSAAMHVRRIIRSAVRRPTGPPGPVRQTDLSRPT